MIPKRTLVAATCLAVLPFSGRAEPPAPASQRVAIDGTTERVLLDACAYLRSAQRFSVRADISYDEVLKSGPAPAASWGEGKVGVRAFCKPSRKRPGVIVQSEL